MKRTNEMEISVIDTSELFKECQLEAYALSKGMSFDELKKIRSEGSMDFQENEKICANFQHRPFHLYMEADGHSAVIYATVTKKTLTITVRANYLSKSTIMLYSEVSGEPNKKSNLALVREANSYLRLIFNEAKKTIRSFID